MYTLSEENAWRAVKLCDNNTLGTIYDKCAVACHIRNCTEEDILRDSIELFMIRISTVEFHSCLQGYAICQSSLETLINSVAWRVDIVIQELKHEIVTSIGNREVLGEHLIKTVVLAFLRRSI